MAAVFHQIQMFCASTRPGHAFPDALRFHGMQEQAELLDEIVASESGHGKELATMAAYIVNKSPNDAAAPAFTDLSFQIDIERRLKSCSDRVFGETVAYDKKLGLTREAAEAITVFDRRHNNDYETTIENLGSALALEIISNRHLIPGEKEALVDSGSYRASLDDPPMHYLKEHWGECGAEQQHELNVIAAVDAVLDARTHPIIITGIDRLLDSLAALWDRLDSVLPQHANRSTGISHLAL